MVEFKRDARDGVSKLLEINGRFWGSLQLSVDAGVDFPHLLYRLAIEGDVEPVSTYATGVRLRWGLGNVDWLLLRLRETGRPSSRAGVPDSEPAGWRASEVLRARRSGARRPSSCPSTSADALRGVTARLAR